MAWPYHRNGLYLRPLNKDLLNTTESKFPWREESYETRLKFIQYTLSWNVFLNLFINNLFHKNSFFYSITKFYYCNWKLLRPLTMFNRQINNMCNTITFAETLRHFVLHSLWGSSFLLGFHNHPLCFIL